MDANNDAFVQKIVDQFKEIVPQAEIKVSMAVGEHGTSYPRIEVTLKELSNAHD